MEQFRESIEIGRVAAFFRLQSGWNKQFLTLLNRPSHRYRFRSKIRAKLKLGFQDFDPLRFSKS